MNRRNSDLANLTRGVAAGVLATWAMGKVTTYLYERENPAAREREDAAREGKTAFGVAAEKGAQLAGIDLSDDARPQAGQAIHWMLGAGAGALYAVLRSRVPSADAGFGLLYGAAFFLLVDELGNVAFGLTPAPRAFPWQAHGRGLAGHLAFGVSAELVLRATDPFSP